MRQACWIFFFYFLNHKALVLGQVNCQDPQAINFNPLATQTDTSCQYPVTERSTSLVCNLPVALNEASSMLQADGKWFIINDSGNPADVFQINESGNCSLVKTTRISNFSNIDWEDLAADSQYLYIGDFGNNNGNRNNLRILKVRKSALFSPDSLSIQASKLDFSYPDQTSFVSSNSHNFDCEAFFNQNGKLHLFSKNRGNQKTKHYSLDPNQTVQVAQLHDSLEVGGLITSASISPDGKTVVLLGHENGGSLGVFTWLLFGFESNDFFKGNRRKIWHDNMLFNGQTEGIGFKNQDTLLISNEKLATIPAAIRKVEIGSLLKPFFTTETKPIVQSPAEKIYPNPFTETLFIPLKNGESYRLFDQNGKEIMAGNESVLTLKNEKPGLYFLKIMTKNGKSSLIKSIFKIK